MMDVEQASVTESVLDETKLNMKKPWKKMLKLSNMKIQLLEMDLSHYELQNKELKREADIRDERLANFLKQEIDSTKMTLSKVHDLTALAELRAENAALKSKCEEGRLQCIEQERVIDTIREESTSRISELTTELMQIRKKRETESERAQQRYEVEVAELRLAAQTAKEENVRLSESLKKQRKENYDLMLSFGGPNNSEAVWKNKCQDLMKENEMLRENARPATRRRKA